MVNVAAELRLTKEKRGNIYRRKKTGDRYLHGRIVTGPNTKVERFNMSLLYGDKVRGWPFLSYCMLPSGLGWKVCCDDALYYKYMLASLIHPVRVGGCVIVIPTLCWIQEFRLCGVLRVLSA